PGWCRQRCRPFQRRPASGRYRASLPLPGKPQPLRCLPACSVPERQGNFLFSLRVPYIRTLELRTDAEREDIAIESSGLELPPAQSCGRVGIAVVGVNATQIALDPSLNTRPQRVAESVGSCRRRR